MNENTPTKVTTCKNGLTVSTGFFLTESASNQAWFQIDGGDASRRTVSVTTYDVADRIAKMLIEDFGGTA